MSTDFSMLRRFSVSGLKLRAEGPHATVALVGIPTRHPELVFVIEILKRNRYQSEDQILSIGDSLAEVLEDEIGSCAFATLSRVSREDREDLGPRCFPTSDAGRRIFKH